MADPTTSTRNFNIPVTGSDVGTWGTSLNSNFTNLDAAFGGTQTITVTGLSGSYTLTSSYPVVSPSFSYLPFILKFTGTLSASVTFNIPSGVAGIWSINTSGVTFGAYSITIQTSGGTGITITAQTTTIIYSDGSTVNYSLPFGGQTTFVPTTTTVTGSGGLTGGGALSSNVSLSIASGSNGYGTRTVSTGSPSGGSDGDVWYQV
jgi:hypothetical protein